MSASGAGDAIGSAKSIGCDAGPEEIGAIFSARCTVADARFTVCTCNGETLDTDDVDLRIVSCIKSMHTASKRSVDRTLPRSMFDGDEAARSPAAEGWMRNM